MSWGFEIIGVGGGVAGLVGDVLASWLIGHLCRAIAQGSCWR